MKFHIWVFHEISYLSISWNFIFEYFMKFYIWVFHEILYLSIFFENLSREIKLYQNLTRIRGSLHEDQYNFLIVSCQILLRMKTISDKSCRKIRNTHFIFTNFFFFRKSCLFEIMWKTCVERGRTQMILRRMHIVWLIHKATNTLTGYVIYNTYFSSPATTFAWIYLNVKLRLHCLSCYKIWCYPE